jgi:hypothetical protein
MGFVDWIMSLFGKKTDAPAPAADGSMSAEERQKIRTDAVSGLEDVEGAENIHVHGEGDSARVVKHTPGADLIEEDGETQWVDRVNKDVPREQWQDVWGPVGKVANDLRLEEFCLHERQFDEARQGDPLAAEQKLLAFGYSSVGEFYHVRTTVLKYFATPQGPNVGDAIIDSQTYMNAVMRADARIRDAKGAAVRAANPEMFAPVEGVTLEGYANISARLAQGMQQAELVQLLGTQGLDFAAWSRASTVWNDRMSKDTTHTITTAYGAAFSGAGQGQFAAQAKAAAATNMNGSAAGGPEPMPFDKCCEIQGAMAAWSKSGKDVNALLKSKFNMNAAEFSAAHTWWLTQLMADIPRFNDYTAKCDAHEKRYAESLGGGDSDIQF